MNIAVIPVSRSPSRIARWMGDAPRYFGSSEPWALTQPYFGKTRTSCGRMFP